MQPVGGEGVPDPSNSFYKASEEKKNTENISDTPRNSVGPDVSLKA